MLLLSTLHTAPRRAVQARSALMPYIYSQMRAAYDSGVGLLYPMYYDYPASDEAYAGTKEGAMPQYMFGPDIMVRASAASSRARARGVVVIWRRRPRECWLPL
jgi:alpha-glucosidase (family GH31 glycosyl hydrolase)